MATGRRRPLVAGNWKMNGLRAAAAELDRIIQGAGGLAAVDVLVCPPATLLAQFAAAAQGGPVRIGAQDCHAEPSGAFTGDLSAEMLKDAAVATIRAFRAPRLPWGNRRRRARGARARRAGLMAIVCVGETHGEREAGRALAVVGGQLGGSLPDGATAENLVVAYEPVWAIGTGLTPTPADVAEMHGFIRRQLIARYGEAGQGMRILYGGSVKPSNAKELMGVADVDGALVGGASLKADEFLAIADVYR